MLRTTLLGKCVVVYFDDILYKNVFNVVWVELYVNLKQGRFVIDWLIFWSYVLLTSSHPSSLNLSINLL